MLQAVLVWAFVTWLCGHLSPSKYMGGTLYAAPLTSSLMSSNQWVGSEKQEVQILSQSFLTSVRDHPHETTHDVLIRKSRASRWYSWRSWCLSPWIAESHGDYRSGKPLTPAMDFVWKENEFCYIHPPRCGGLAYSNTKDYKSVIKKINTKSVNLRFDLTIISIGHFCK